jgi:protoheme IX farnesyltransferase
MLAYTLLMIPLSVAPYMLGIAGIGYGIFAFVISIFFLFTNFRVLVDKSDKSAKLMFGYSVFYLFALFTALMIDKV